jgi:hypothetical protein
LRHADPIDPTLQFVPLASFDFGRFWSALLRCGQHTCYAIEICCMAAAVAAQRTHTMPQSLA